MIPQIQERRQSPESAEARKRQLDMKAEPLLCAHWHDALMLHFAVDPEVLQPALPYELDTLHGLAYVSLVAFTMRDMRPSKGGAWTAWLMKPIASHAFLNMRTYVKHKGETGIYFLAEWLPNRLSVKLGPSVFGLPYRHAHIRYAHDTKAATVAGEVAATGSTTASLSYQGKLESAWQTAEAGSLNEFLHERYTAFTVWHRIKRLFRVWHPPWTFTPAHVCITENSLLHGMGEWAEHAGFVSATYSAGFCDVWMSRPQWL